ncbi:hypothetical protein [Bremerella sp. P1]|uniref:hypothetical protein n=1 Tax=Bremerella sp. P1 TaxID=3026424 RepID=UPI00236757B2|nr:hypothetical protein [Bremerella sp. P1]WDI43729.1 hypothetical protein PSR63_07185 [Bremerella sp. P1]
MANGPNDFEEYPYFFLPRPKGQIQSLPVEFRWEVTRRHPAYVSFWEPAGEFFAAVLNATAQEEVVRPIAAVIVNAVGVSGAAPDPSLEFDELGDQGSSNSWRSGAISPLTIRGMISRLLVVLKPEEFRQIMQSMLDAMESKDDEVEQRMEALLSLQRIGEPLDNAFPEPLVTINPRMANGIVKRDVDLLLSEWRDRLAINMGRDRSDKYVEYLQVWDAREGWEKGTYFADREQTLREVAETLGIDDANANSRYRRAFELITGYQYSPAMWVRFMGIVKLSQSSVEALGRIARRRPLRNRASREVPESVLSPSEGTQGIISGLSLEVGRANEELLDLMIDISQRMDSGASNEEIQESLGIAGELNEVLDLLRSQFG